MTPANLQTDLLLEDLCIAESVTFRTHGVCRHEVL